MKIQNTSSYYINNHLDRFDYNRPTECNKYSAFKWLKIVDLLES